MAVLRQGAVATLVVVLGAASPVVAAEEAEAACVRAHPELARGFSLTGWFDGRVSRPPDFAVLAELRTRGMTHVRLPIAAESVMTRFTPAAAVTKRRQAIAAGIDALTARGYAVVVDLHGGDALGKLFGQDPDAAQAAVVQAWTALGPIVERRAARRVSAEILNEPPLADDAWTAMQARIVAAIRPIMPTTTLVVSTGGPQRVERLTAAEPLADRNTVYAVHYYDPMAFTHQGAEWIRPDPIGWLHDVPFPILASDPRLASLVRQLRAAGQTRVADYVSSLMGRSFAPVDVQRDMRALGAWSRKYGRAVVLGEFGVYRPHVVATHRTAWLAAVTTAANANCLGWTHWDYRDGFGLINGATGKPDEATLAGLAGITRTKGDPLDEN
jgi:endoglucanase